MKLSKRITGIALSTIMAVSQVMPVMADNATTATAGTGNVLAYTNNEILAPTAIQVSFNPQGYDFILRDGADAVTSQIVSLNYGFASNATNDMIAKVSFEASYTEDPDADKQIEFVATEDEVTNAEKGELKVYLAVATSTAKIQAAAGEDGTAFEVDDNGASTATAALLSDVAMTAATEGNVAFVDNKAEIALKLDKATYTVKDDYEVTFETTQEDLESNMILAEDGLGGIGGFTFVGKMNADADWTKANVAAIAITPTFDLTQEATEDDEAIDGTYAQVNVAPAAPVYEIVSGAYDSANTRYQFTLDEEAAITDVAEVTNFTINGHNLTGAVTKNNAGTVIRITRDQVKAALGEEWGETTADSDLTITFKIDTVNYKSVVKRG
jgi:hypothetical protein